MSGGDNELDFGIEVDKIDASQVIVGGNITFGGGNVGRACQELAYKGIVDVNDVLSVEGLDAEVDEFAVAFNRIVQCMDVKGSCGGGHSEGVNDHF